MKYFDLSILTEAPPTDRVINDVSDMSPIKKNIIIDISIKYYIERNEIAMGPFRDEESGKYFISIMVDKSLATELKNYMVSSALNTRMNVNRAGTLDANWFSSILQATRGSDVGVFNQLIKEVRNQAYRKLKQFGMTNVTEYKQFIKTLDSIHGSELSDNKILNNVFDKIKNTKFNKEVKLLAANKHFGNHTKLVEQLKALEQTKIAMIQELQSKTGLGAKQLTGLLRTHDIGELLYTHRKLTK